MKIVMQKLHLINLYSLENGKFFIVNIITYDRKRKKIRSSLRRRNRKVV